MKKLLRVALAAAVVMLLSVGALAAEGELDLSDSLTAETFTYDFSDELPSGDELLMQDLDLSGGVMPLGEIGSTPSYNTLNSQQRALYTELRAWLEDLNQQETDVSTVWSRTYSYSEFQNIYDNAVKGDGQGAGIIVLCRCLMLDCPSDFYWWDRHISYGYRSDGSRWTITLTFGVADDYTSATQATVSGAQLQRAHRAVENARTIWEYANSSSLNDFEKLNYYRQQICDLVSYNYNAANNSSQWNSYAGPWSMVWVFDKDPSTNVVCEGYSKAFQLLCDNTVWDDPTIQCFTVSGYMDSGAHMWNIVQIQGTNYLVDVTNCDSGMVGYPDGLFLAGGSGSPAAGYMVSSGSARIRYTYSDTFIDNSVLTLSPTKYVYTPLPTLTGTVSITGTPKAGSTLQADTSRLNGAATGLTYEWKVGGVTAGTSSTYTVKAADVDKQITVTVKAKNYTGSVTSSAVTATDGKVHGKVSVSAVYAPSGTTIQVTLTPETGYKAGPLTVTTADGRDIKVTRVNDNFYTFTMPAADVELHVDFLKA